MPLTDTVTALPARQTLPAEERFATELAFLAAHDDGPRPPGWLLTPRAVITFVCGSGGDALKLPDAPEGLPDELVIAPKFVGERALVERCVVTLAGERGLLLVGEPGTAKSMLSELLSAAVCGTSALTVQGTAGTTEDALRYGWNYALLLAQGPTPLALVDSPVLAAMRAGKVARVEEPAPEQHRPVGGRGPAGLRGRARVDAPACAEA
ncbi:AAA family ATPase, partial [Streptomyces sp. NPDC001139]